MREMVGMVWVLVPVVAIIGGIASAIAATFARARVRELEIRGAHRPHRKGDRPAARSGSAGIRPRNRPIRQPARVAPRLRHRQRRPSSPRRDHAPRRRLWPHGPHRLQRQPGRRIRRGRIHLRAGRRISDQQLLRIALGPLRLPIRRHPQGPRAPLADPAVATYRFSPASLSCLIQAPGADKQAEWRQALICRRKVLQKLGLLGR